MRTRHSRKVFNISHWNIPQINPGLESWNKERQEEQKKKEEEQRKGEEQKGGDESKKDEQQPAAYRSARGGF